jgi:hypothetical protein
MDTKLQDQCICRICPSHEDCGEPIGYCLPEVHKSSCITSELGCVCTGCPVWEKLKLDREYYCLR